MKQEERQFIEEELREAIALYRKAVADFDRHFDMSMDLPPGHAEAAVCIRLAHQHLKAATARYDAALVAHQRVTASGHYGNENSKSIQSDESA